MLYRNVVVREGLLSPGGPSLAARDVLSPYTMYVSGAQNRTAHWRPTMGTF